MLAEVADVIEQSLLQEWAIISSLAGKLLLGEARRGRKTKVKLELIDHNQCVSKLEMTIDVYMTIGGLIFAGICYFGVILSDYFVVP
jgi:hypothetical protein